MSRVGAIKPLAAGMRSPFVAPGTRFLLGVPLFLLSTSTDRFFAWTILPPLTAAFLGASYWSSAFMAYMASRERTWAEGRIAAYSALVFAPVTTAATFMHLDLFHLDTFYGWFWVIAYGIYPPMLAYLLYRQLQTPGGDPPRRAALASWVRVLLAVQGALLLPVGVALFVAPESMNAVWPWDLTPLTGRVIAAWTLALGVISAAAAWANDVDQARVGLLSFLSFVILQVIALARFSGDFEWGEVGGWAYLAYLATGLAVGLYGLAATRMLPSRTAEPAAR